MKCSQVTLLQEYLERNAERVPDKTALVFKDPRLSWREIHAIAGRTANALRALVVRRGDRVVSPRRRRCASPRVSAA